jgi:hypothetical protein
LKNPSASRPRGFSLLKRIKIGDWWSGGPKTRTQLDNFEINAERFNTEDTEHTEKTYYRAP